MLKFCEYCHKIQEYNHQCNLKPKRTTSSNHNKFYSTTAWNKKQKQIKENFYGIDVYEYVVNQKIVYGTVVHHIVPIKDNDSLKLSNSNLILLSDSTHKLIHKMLDKDYNATINLMHNCISQFKKSLGGYSKCFF